MTAVRLGRVARLVTDRADKQEFRLGLEGIQGFTGRLRPGVMGDYDGDGLAFRPGDVLFGKLRPYLSKSWVADRQGAAVGDFHVYRPSPALTSRYLGYVLLGRSFLDPVTASVAGAKMPRTNWEFVRNVEIFLPPPAEQVAIADYLDRETAQIDALIAKQEQLIKTSGERRAAVVDAAFLSGDQMVPTRVRHLLATRPSYSVLVPSYVDDSDAVPFVRVGDLGHLDEGLTLPMIPPAQSAEFARTRLRGGELLLGVVGNMGKCAIAPMWLAGANVARAVAVLRCRPDVQPLLLARWFGTRHFLDQARLSVGSDTAQPTLGMKDLAGFALCWPDDASAEARVAGHLDEQTAKVDALIGKAEQFIDLAKERRSALITAAVTGQIDLSTTTSVGEDV